MRLLMIGDIMGRPGRLAVKENLPGLISELKLDFIIANGENAAGGNGITKEIARELFGYGIDMFTMGNHVWNKREIIEYLPKEPRIIRPANYPPGTPGVGYNIYRTKSNIALAVINLSGRVYMQELDCPFRLIDEILQRIAGETKCIFVDFHAEATSEKVAMGWYLAGRVSAVCGTHTHVQTADERILPGGTAYITDLGMTGPKDSVIGVKKEIIIEKFLTALPKKFEVAGGPYQFNGLMIEVDELTGEALDLRRIYMYQ